MKKIFRITPTKALFIAKKLTNLVITGTSIEFGCFLVSYTIYLYTKQQEWLYYGIPMICILHNCLSGTKYHYGSPVAYVLFLTCAYNKNFPITLLCTSIITALTCLCLNHRKPVSIRIYLLSKNLFTAFYFIAFILLALVFIYIITSMFFTNPDILKEILRHACIFVFSVILPILFLAIDNYKEQETITIPKILRWIQLIIETIIQLGTIYFGFCIIQMPLRSLTPRPYVIYIVIAMIMTIELSAKLHNLSAKNWNDLFFSHRNLFYIPLILIGIAALYIEYSLVGYRPRTLAATILLIWISIICFARLTGFRSIISKERIISLYISISLMISICISTITY